MGSDEADAGIFSQPDGEKDPKARAAHKLGLFTGDLEDLHSRLRSMTDDPEHQVMLDDETKNYLDAIQEKYALESANEAFYLLVSFATVGSQTIAQQTAAAYQEQAGRRDGDGPPPS